MGRGVVHFEIGGADAPALQSFYAKQFGWKVDAANPMQYGVVDTKTGGKGINGGICPSMDGGPPSWVTVYIEVDSIDQALAKIEKAGGRTVVPRTPIPDMVVFAQFADPAGNVVGLVESTMPAADPPETAPEGSKKKGSKKKASKKKASKKKGSAPAKKATASRPSPPKERKATKKKAAKKKAAKKKRK